MHLPINSTLQGGKYRIVRFINSGGFGCTYEAEYALMNTHVAIKEFFVKDLCERNESNSHITIVSKSKSNIIDKLKKKFIEEARSLFQMQHPGIVRVIDIFEENDTAYYAMEYIDGISLQEMVKMQGNLSESVAVKYIKQVADALLYVHNKHRLHLDIKPGNIMINREGKAVLIDFGASKHYDEETGENTSTLLGINTRGYAPAEQMTQSFSSFNPSTDIYALGATLYKLLTGLTPPDAVAILSGEATLSKLGSISPTLRHTIQQAMQPKRANRPQSIPEFLSLLNSSNSTKSDDDEVIEATLFETDDCNKDKVAQVKENRHPNNTPRSRNTPHKNNPRNRSNNQSGNKTVTPVWKIFLYIGGGCLGLIFLGLMFIGLIADILEGL